MNPVDEKRALRQRIRQLKAENRLDDEQRTALADNVFGVIERTLTAFSECHHILMYHELPDELPATRWALKWQSDGKRIYLPRIKGDTLDVVELDNDLAPDARYGILEPTGAPLDDLSLIDLAIVPAVALDCHGNRMGRGKGFYDRLLPRLSRAITVGVCYDFQLVDRIPTDAHDVPLQFVVTPTFHNLL
ncbi:MAG: 5-formyltetrahydrofolate cyclo-ligase [Muribaculaceae bacterium]|nr:5-formyltetrahydrofolate cyclo-ligase [Muribaculaceae bacterium]